MMQSGLAADAPLESRLTGLEQRLRECEERFRTIADRLPLMIWVHDAKGEQEFVNQTFCEYFGVSREEMRSSRWQLLTHPSDGTGYIDEFLKCVREQQDFHAEVKVQRADGEWRWLESWGRARFDREGVFQGHVGASADITDRITNQQKINFLMGEVNHRVKNILTVVQAIARYTASAHEEDFQERFAERIGSLAASHDLLVRNDWDGVDLADLIASQLAHFKELIGIQIQIIGPQVRLTASAAQMLGMAVHELGTNAAKYGALSLPAGRVTVRWRLDDTTFFMDWIESGTPTIKWSEKKGFGTVVIDRMTKMTLGGGVEIDRRPDGMAWHIECPTEMIMAQEKSVQPGSIESSEQLCGQHE
jgi:PAS domain S-box-containing protein